MGLSIGDWKGATEDAGDRPGSSLRLTSRRPAWRPDVTENATTFHRVEGPRVGEGTASLSAQFVLKVLERTRPSRQERVLSRALNACNTSEVELASVYERKPNGLRRW